MSQEIVETTSAGGIGMLRCTTFARAVPVVVPPALRFLTGTRFALLSLQTYEQSGSCKVAESVKRRT
jgi:hypothetical protein